MPLIVDESGAIAPNLLQLATQTRHGGGGETVADDTGNPYLSVDRSHPGSRLGWRM